MDRRKGSVLKSLHVTEKASVLQRLSESESNKSVRACKTQKYVFVVDPAANKQEIKKAVEETFKDKHVKVLKVNTINLPRKKKKVKGSRKMGTTSQLKKAIVTLQKDCHLDFEL